MTHRLPLNIFHECLCFLAIRIVILLFSFQIQLTTEKGHTRLQEVLLIRRWVLVFHQRRLKLATEVKNDKSICIAS